MTEVTHGLLSCHDVPTYQYMTQPVDSDQMIAGSIQGLSGSFGAFAKASAEGTRAGDTRDKTETDTDIVACPPVVRFSLSVQLDEHNQE